MFAWSLHETALKFTSVQGHMSGKPLQNGKPHHVRRKGERDVLGKSHMHSSKKSVLRGKVQAGATLICYRNDFRGKIRS